MRCHQTNIMQHNKKIYYNTFVVKLRSPYEKNIPKVRVNSLIEYNTMDGLRTTYTIEELRVSHSMISNEIVSANQNILLGNN